MHQVPTWVFILFFVLVWLGYKRCFTRTIRLERLFLMPAIFVFMNLNGVISLFQFTAGVLILYLLGLAGGAVSGHFQVRNRIIRADRVKRLIEVPGDLAMLFLVIGIFIIEFFIHYAVEANWSISTNSAFPFIAIMASGLISGISVGRNSTYFYKFLNATSTALILEKE